GQGRGRAPSETLRARRSRQARADAGDAPVLGGAAQRTGDPRGQELRSGAARRNRARGQVTTGQEPADRAVLLLRQAGELLFESRNVAQQLEQEPEVESPAAAAERHAYGLLVAALEEGLTTAHTGRRARRGMDQRAGAEARRQTLMPAAITGSVPEDLA